MTISFFHCGKSGVSNICETPHCLGKTTDTCQFPLQGKLPFCGRRLCERCRERIRDEIYCGPHARMIRAPRRPR